MNVHACALGFDVRLDCVPADIRKNFGMQRDNLVHIEKTNIANAADDYHRCVRLLSGGEDMSHPHGRHQWMGLAAHIAIYPVPLTRQVVTNHWEAGIRSMGTSVT